MFVLIRQIFVAGARKRIRIHVVNGETAVHIPRASSSARFLHTTESPGAERRESSLEGGCDTGAGDIERKGR